MIVFLDTEFTDLQQPQLLSIGLASMPGEFFYTELDLTTDIGKERFRASTDFVRNGGVLEQWGLVPEPAATDSEMGQRAGAWLLRIAAAAGAKVEVAFDSNVDYELLEQAIRNAGMWERVREAVVPINVNAITGTNIGVMAAETFYAEPLKPWEGGFLKRHHALADAKALREAYAAVKAHEVLSAAEARRLQA